MSRRTMLSCFAALAFLATPVFTLADSGQPCPCAQGCASHSNAKQADRKEAKAAPQSISPEMQQAIWTSP